MEEVIANFEKKYTKLGVALTISQLLSFAKEKNLKGVTRAKIGSYLATRENISQFSPTQKTKVFQTIGVPRIGLYHLDYGEFHKQWAGSNGGKTGFLVAVENFTNKLFIVPCKGKGSDEWYSAIDKFVELTREVRTIYSDRDAVATSPKFRENIVKNFGISWFFLKKGNKSYLAERYIGFVKKKLSQALLAKGGKNWTPYVEPLQREYNREKIEGTSYRRQAVCRSNFLHFLSQLLNIKDPELHFNSFKAGPFVTEKWNLKIFKFKIGQKVLLARKANWKEREEKSTAFTKASVVGGYSSKLFTISGRQLRRSKKTNPPTLVAVYSLQEMGPSLHFYQSELKSAAVAKK